jgi:hypothetical protein
MVAHGNKKVAGLTLATAMICQPKPEVATYFQWSGRTAVGKIPFETGGPFV